MKLGTLESSWSVPQDVFVVALVACVALYFTLYFTRRKRFSPLKHRILILLWQYGQQSEFGLYVRFSDQETGGLAATILIACLELERDGYVEPWADQPQMWQLTQKGQNYVKQEQNQEVAQ
jgi:hypothetical protein